MIVDSSTTAAAERARILLVDDSAIQALALGRILRQSGFDVLLAGGGHEALERIAQNDCAMVLSDVRMPAMDGFALCRAIKGAHRSLPVVLLTAFAEPLDIMRGLAAGADGFLSKSSSASQLLSRLERALAGAREE
jgi:CheY-like chemotaxis protein